MPRPSPLRGTLARISKIASLALALAIFLAVSLAAIGGLLLSQILHPPRSPANVDLDVMIGHPSAFSFTAPDGGSRDGWFFPGLRGAPVIVLCHGYGSQRTDILTLATALQEHQFNAYLFDFSGHGSRSGSTTLGYKETGELRSAIQALAGRDDVDPRRFGLWGTDLGAYAALEVAVSDKRIAGFIVDDAYDDPRDMLQIQASHSGLTSLPFIGRLCVLGFDLINYSHQKDPPVSSHFAALAGVPKIFIQSADRSALASETLRLFYAAPAPKQIVHDSASYSNMSDDDRKGYENQVVSFFLQNLPPQQQ